MKFVFDDGKVMDVSTDKDIDTVVDSIMNTLSIDEVMKLIDALHKHNAKTKQSTTKPSTNSRNISVKDLIAEINGQTSTNTKPKERGIIIYDVNGNDVTDRRLNGENIPIKAVRVLSNRGFALFYNMVNGNIIGSYGNINGRGELYVYDKYRNMWVYMNNDTVGDYMAIINDKSRQKEELNKEIKQINKYIDYANNIIAFFQNLG